MILLLIVTEIWSLYPLNLLANGLALVLVVGDSVKISALARCKVAILELIKQSALCSHTTEINKKVA